MKGRTAITATARTLVRELVAPRVSDSVAERLDDLVQLISVRGRAARLDARMRRLARSRRPILVGPWLSEVGFELLYWIPFLNWATAHYRLDAARLVVMSRGGTQPWYRHLTTRYLDTFSFVSVAEFKAGNEQRIREQGNLFKHISLSGLDRRLLAAARHQLRVDAMDVLHPSLMYRLFTPFIRRRGTVQTVLDHTDFSRFAGPALHATVADLPQPYVAVRFYFNPVFPDTPSNRAFVACVFDRLRAKGNIVLLNTGLSIDDHSDWHTDDELRRSRSVAQLCTPMNNLDIQSQVVSRARAFVGTYGGLSYLAPHYGIDSLAFFSYPDNLVPQHLELARRVLPALGSARYTALHATDLGTLADTGVV